MKSHYPLLVQSADHGVPGLLRRQCMDRDNREYGGFPEPRKGFSEPAHAIGIASALAVLSCNDRSCYYRNTEILDRAILAADHALRLMHADGTMDLVETNFHDATSVGFAIWNVSPAFRVMERYGSANGPQANLRDKLLEFMRRGADGMKNGGFHTPNHRWVMASAMAMLSNDLGRPDLVPEVELYLGEGIDCNADGEYSERSAGIYNVVNNKGLLVLADELDMPHLLDHVQRNLYMMYCYLEPDDTVLTINSRRQDHGEKLYPLAYYENYLLAAHRLNNAHFAHTADELLHMTNGYAEDPSALSRQRLPKPIALYMLDDAVRETEPEREWFNRDTYERFFRDSSIVRIRRGPVSATILAGSDVFLKVQIRRLDVACRFAASFFGEHGRFIPDTLQAMDGGYRLRYRSERGYVRPLGRPDRPIRGGRINTEHREHTHMQIYDVTVEIRPQPDGVLLRLVTAGVENLPCKLELILPPDGHFTSGDTQFRAVPGQHAMVTSGTFDYLLGDDRLRIEGASGGSTTYHYALRGSLPPEADAFTVYCTDLSPTERTMRIRGI